MSESAWRQLRRETVACTRCRRLVSYRRRVAREKKRQFAEWDYWGAPLSGFGDINAKLLIVGLAPAAHGGNRTGRMFTGDGSANFLMRALHKAGFANQPTSEHRHDGLQLEDAFVTAVVRCPPPENRPLANELANCSILFDRELALLPNIRVTLALGRVAFNGYLIHVRRMGFQVPHARFKHGRGYSVPGWDSVIVASYHPSRQNTQTRRLTSAMMDRAIATVKSHLDKRG